MTLKEVEAKLCAAADEVAAECTARLQSLPPGAALERQAMKIRKGLAEFCGKAGVMLGCAAENPADWRRRSAIHYAADEGERQLILSCPVGEATYLHALIFMERRFLRRYREELEKARAYGDDETVFKQETQIGALEAILAKWRAFGKEAGFRGVD